MVPQGVRKNSKKVAVNKLKTLGELIVAKTEPTGNNLEILALDETQPTELIEKTPRGSTRPSARNSKGRGDRCVRLPILVNPENPLFTATLQALQTTAESLNVVLHKFEARDLNEIEIAFAAMAERQVGAVVGMREGRVLSCRRLS